jgi:hypothetical protein
MNDPNRKNERNHWQAIAEQLGLAPDNGFPQPVREPEIIAAPQEPPTHRGPSQEAVYQVPSAVPIVDEDQPSSAFAPEEPVSPHADLFAPDEPGPSDVGLEASRPNVEQQDRPGEQQRGKRRRGGRGRRDGGGNRGPREPRPQDEDRRRQPNHGRGRPRPEPEELEPEPMDEVEDELPEIAVADLDDDSEADDLSNLSKNWTVPSWNELIDSLYRPDR